MIDISIQKGNETQTYCAPKMLTTLLEALLYIQEHSEPTLGFDYGCKSGVCGACSVEVNGKKELACSYHPQGQEIIEPLRYYPVKRDLIVDKSSQASLLKSVKATVENYTPTILNEEDEAKTATQSDCILCSSCYSACPVIEVNKDFLGPFALSQALRYNLDERDNTSKERLEAVQANGIWDCTLCNECTLACPQDIDPKSDIMHLRNQSAQHGYSDPNLTTMNFGNGFGDFGNGF